MKEWKKDLSYKQKPKKAGVAIFILDKIDLKTKVVIRDKDGYCVTIKGPIQQ